MTENTPGNTSITRNHTRKRRVRTASLVAAMAALGFAAACSDAVTAPELKRGNELTGGVLTLAQSVLINVTGLMRKKPLTASVARSANITQRDGGRIEIPELGFRLDIPAGAIPAASMVITVTALPGSMVAYDFQPHGTKFLKPLSIRQDLNGSNWDNLGVKGKLNGGYFKDVSQLNLTAGTAKLDETFPVTLQSSRLSFDIIHFSGYMVSTGRTDATAPEAF